MSIRLVAVVLAGFAGIGEASAFSPHDGPYADPERLTAQVSPPAASPTPETEAPTEVPAETPDAAAPGEAPDPNAPQTEETVPTADPAANPEPPAAAPAGPAPPAEQSAPAEARPADPEPGSAPTVETDPAPEQFAAPEILRGEAAMPEPVRNTWRRLVEAAKSGDFEQLRPIIEGQPEPPQVAFDEIEDPLDYLKTLAGDAESREILAIMLEVLETGFVHVDQGTAEEMFIWPYFARYPLDNLLPSQFVELFRLLTSADYEEMRSYGAYIFFRLGIAPDGTWRFFIAGD